MKNAADFARIAANLSQLADTMRPGPDESFAVLRNEVTVYLRLAASKTRAIAEGEAERESRQEKSDVG